MTPSLQVALVGHQYYNIYTYTISFTILYLLHTLVPYLTRLPSLLLPPLVFPLSFCTALCSLPQFAAADSSRTVRLSCLLLSCYCLVCDVGQQHSHLFYNSSHCTALYSTATGSQLLARAVIVIRVDY